MLDLFEKLQNALNDAKIDLDKFAEKGVKAAAVRARKQLQEVRNLAKDLRVAINDTKKKK